MSIEGKVIDRDTEKMEIQENVIETPGTNQESLPMPSEASCTPMPSEASGQSMPSQANLPKPAPPCQATPSQTSEPSTATIMAAEEAKFRSRYPHGPMGGHSLFLQKRLVKGPKYFDSGDYQMAKQTQTKSRILPLLAQPTGDEIPTPESVPVRKTSIIQHSKLTSTFS